jgi:hypothetical protein
MGRIQETKLNHSPGFILSILQTILFILSIPAIEFRPTGLPTTSPKEFELDDG